MNSRELLNESFRLEGSDQANGIGSEMVAQRRLKPRHLLLQPLNG